MPRKKSTVADSTAKAKKTDKMPTRLTGMKDLSQAEQASFDYLLNQILNLAEINNYQQIKVPTIESLNLYKKFLSAEALKQIYNLEADKSEKAVLRPELRAGIIRSYLESNPEPEVKMFQLFSWGSVFSREKAQSGSLRESSQFNFEVLGVKKPIVEAFLLAMISRFLDELGISNQIQINSIGDSHCRKEYCGALNDYIKKNGQKSKLCNACKLNITKNCLSFLNCQSGNCKKISKEAPQIADHLSAESRDYLMRTLEILDELKVNYNFNPFLVGTSYYYNDTVFEIWPLNKDGSAGKLTLGAGGRYDTLSESLGGQELLASGITLNLEKIMVKMRDKTALTNKINSDRVFIAQLGDQAKIKALNLSAELMSAGFMVKQSIITDSLKEQLDLAAKLKARVALILGKKELMDGTILMRDIDSGAQETVLFKKIVDRLVKKLEH